MRHRTKETGHWFWSRFMIHLFAALVVVSTVLVPGTLRADAALWQGLKSGTYVAMMRHALAPGTGDPATFDVEDCSTQRNLDTRGRDQARAVGDLFRSNGIGAARMYSSQWCRCLETAKLMDLGAVEAFSVLNSFFQNREDGPVQTEALQAWLTEDTPDRPVVLVTHQVNITALTGVFPSSGEIVFLDRGANGTVTVAGTIETY